MKDVTFAARSASVAPRLAPNLAPTPIITDSLATAVIFFCALTPFKWERLGIGADLPAEPDQIGWLLLLGLTVLSLVRRRGALVRPAVSLALLPYVAWIALSVFWSVEPSTTMRELAFMCAWVAWGVLIAVDRNLSDLLRLFIRAGTLLLAGSWIIALLVPSIGFTASGDNAGALRGLFIDKNSLGFFAVVMLLGAAARAFHMPIGRSRTRALLAGAFSLVTVIATTSMTALVATFAAVAVAVAVTLYPRLRPPRLLPVAGIALLCLPALMLLLNSYQIIISTLGRDPTLTGRTDIWAIVTRAAAQRPALGYGWRALWIEGSPVTEQLWAENHGTPFFHAHNGYLELIVEVGIVGLALSLVFLLSVIGSSMRRVTRDADLTFTWPIMLVVVLLLYNGTEVMGWTNATWLILVAISSVLTVRVRF